MVTDDGAHARQGDAAGLPPVMLLLRSLDRGGAERQAVVLACGLKARGWQVSVACFYAGGALQADLDRAGVPVLDLAKRGRWDVVAFLLRLRRKLRQARPIVYSWLPTPNLIAVLMKCCCPGLRVVWGVRSSNVDLSRYDWTQRLSFWLERRCAAWADVVIANSESGARLRVANGFPRATMRVVPNGIDTDKFHFDPEGRTRVRSEWHIPDATVLVGLVGRLDPMKDHRGFLRAAALLAARDRRWHFVCVGHGAAEYKAELVALADASGLTDRVTWVAARDDMAAVYSALDIAASSSYGEGFANVVAEAMACERPCVVTDVGDSAAIVGKIGSVVPPGQPLALADGIESAWGCVRDAGEDLRAAVRRRVVEHYDVEALIEQSAHLLETLHAADSPARTAL